jgi:hypothetical protein
MRDNAPLAVECAGYSYKSTDEIGVHGPAKMQGIRLHAENAMMSVRQWSVAAATQGESTCSIGADASADVNL